LFLVGELHAAQVTMQVQVHAALDILVNTITPPTGKLSFLKEQ
jgi:hypothetical protein